MLLSKTKAVAMKSYQNQAELLKEYLLADPIIPSAVIGGIIASKLVYDLAHMASAIHFKSYYSLSRLQRIEWDNRVISTIHAIFITTMSLYLVFISDLFADNQHAGIVILRKSTLSTFALGVSLGYFLADLGMIFWVYPSLGGKEYVVHHLLSAASLAYAMLTGEGQFYTFIVLMSETTTPGINLRWYLDTAGMKRSRLYLVNGVMMFFAWLIARVLLFIYLFYHLYSHADQLKQIHIYGLVLVCIVPVVLFIMNLIWFVKIIKGLKKTIAKRH